ncbi:hypothetical protein BSKO_11580 [Bryopsis sp. KO-2023]|nr:hypothetical protein BSKO_11580 [Bryopsis sp. KO-2023]
MATSEHRYPSDHSGRLSLMNPPGAPHSRQGTAHSLTDSRGVASYPTRKSLITGRCEVPIPWSVKTVDWKFVISSIHWGTVALTLFPILLLVVLKTTPVQPTQRSYPANDPTLRFDFVEVTIPKSIQFLVPMVLFWMMLSIGEFWLYKPLHQVMDNAISAFLFYLTDWGSAVSLAALLCKLFTIMMGRPSPDFFAKCKESYLQECIREGDDSRESFFPLAPTMAMVTAMYNASYVISLVYHRVYSNMQVIRTSSDVSSKNDISSAATLCQPVDGGNLIDRIIEELGHATLMYLIILQIAFAWIIGILTVTDRKSFVSDVNTAMIIGGSIGYVFSERANAFLVRMPRKRDKTPSVQRNATAASDSTSQTIRE